MNKLIGAMGHNISMWGFSRVYGDTEDFRGLDREIELFYVVLERKSVGDKEMNEFRIAFHTIEEQDRKQLADTVIKCVSEIYTEQYQKKIEPEILSALDAKLMKNDPLPGLYEINALNQLYLIRKSLPEKAMSSDRPKPKM